jgi:hypothetical protein
MLAALLFLQADVARFRIKGVARWHHHDHADHRAVLVFKNKKDESINAGYFYHTESHKAAYIMYLLYRGDGKDAADFLDGAKVGSECGGDCRCACVCTGTSSCDGPASQTTGQ